MSGGTTSGEESGCRAEEVAAGVNEAGDELKYSVRERCVAGGVNETDLAPKYSETEGRYGAPARPHRAWCNSRVSHPIVVGFSGNWAEG